MKLWFHVRLLAPVASLVLAAWLPPAAIVTGDVVDALSGRPLARARVTVARLGRGAKALSAIADEQGRFAFIDLAAGRYELSASAVGYSSTELGRFLPGDNFRPLDLVDGERSSQNRLYLWQQGTVSGAVLDDAGDPAPAVNVNALRRDSWLGRTSWRIQQRTRTDDRGMYRLQSLPPGQYVVTVFEQNSTGSSEVNPTVFYPDALVTSQAMVLTIGPGEQRSGIDIVRRRPERATRVYGKVQTPQGGVSSAIRLRRAEARESWSEFDVRLAKSLPDGRFEFTSVSPGQYIVEAIVVPETGVRGGTVRRNVVDLSLSGPLPVVPSAPTWWGEATAIVEVRDGRASSPEVVLQLQPGARISGQVVLDGGSSKSFLQEPPGAFVVATPIDARDLGELPLAPLGADLRFETIGLPPGLYEVAPWTLTAYQWSLESITVQGREMVGRPIELGTSDVRSVVLTLTDRPNELSGLTRNERGEPTGNVGIFVFAKDPALRARLVWSPSRIAAARSGPDGTYRLRGIPPGDYFVATAPVEPGMVWALADRFEVLAASAVSVRIEKGESKVVDLKVRGR